MRVLGLALVGALAALVWTAASASALPEFGRCVISETHEGRYTSSNCTAKAKKVGEKFTGEYEWHNSTTFAARGENTEVGGGFVAPITGIAATFVKCVPSEEKVAKCKEGETEERVPIEISCEGGESKGIFSTKSDKEVRDVKWRLNDCTTMGVSCGNSVGFGGTPEIDTSLLKGVLGYIKKGEPKEVGLAYKPESGAEVAKFNCGGDMDIIVGGAKEKEGPAHPPKGGGGAAIGALTPINEMVDGVNQVFTVNGAGENVPSSFEGKGLQALEAWFYSPELLGRGSKWSPAAVSGSAMLSLCGSCDGGAGMTEVKA